MTDPVIIAIPSKGRLMEKAEELFAGAGLAIERIGDARGYRGRLSGVEGVEVAFLSAGEIAHKLGDGSVHMGVTGIDLLREHIADTDEKIDLVRRLDFGHADVVVAVPECWFDVDTMADLTKRNLEIWQEMQEHVLKSSGLKPKTQKHETAAKDKSNND